jgi:nucleoside-diphosphate-sugar epimerase
MTDRPVAIVGAGGFIGRALAERLAAQGRPVIAILRRDLPLPAPLEKRVAGTLSAASSWPALLKGAGSVVHLATRAHAPPGSDHGWIAAEAAMTEALAAAAREARVERLLFMSSIKVHGEATAAAAFTAAMPPAPADPYGRAKLLAEERLRRAGLPLVVLRPPLVYGPGVKANFRALLGAVARGLPLPLGAIDNRRSLVFLGNLLDLVETALVHPGAPGGTFLLRDDEEVSTPDLIRRIARALGRRARLFATPPAALRLAGALAGRSAAAARLMQSLRIDDRATRETLGWSCRYTLDEGLAETGRWFQLERQSGRQLTI